MEATHSTSSATVVDLTPSKFALGTAVFFDITATILHIQGCKIPWHVWICHTFGR